MKQIFFCGGLPRTGSTLLMGILQENPEIFTTSTCPTPHIIYNIVTKARHDNSFMSMNTLKADDALYSLVHGGLSGWFESITDKPTIISKNRAWSDIYYLFPETKFICLVRDLRDIFDSFLKVENRFKSLKTFDKYSQKIVATMSHEEIFEFYFGKGGVIDSPAQSIINLIEMEKNITFIKYEDLTENPKKVLSSLYEFLGLHQYDHNLIDIKSPELYEHDSVYFNEKVIHEVHSNLIKNKSDGRKFPDHFYDRIVEKYDWFYQKFYNIETL